MIKLIAAVGKNYELGKNGGLIWHLPNDLKFFKEQTIGHPVAMGKNTFDSLPRLLPGRKHYVLSDVMEFNKPIDDVDVFDNFSQFLLKCKEISKKEDIYIIGGASMYRQFIDIADEIILTEIEATDNTADVYFPRFDSEAYSKKVVGENEDNGIRYFHVIYAKN